MKKKGAPSYATLRKEFAQLCAFPLPPRQRELRYEEALGEFDELCADHRVQFMGIKHKQIYLGTQPLVMVVDDKTVRHAGSYVNCIDTQFRVVRIESVRDVKKRGDIGPQHPHVYQRGEPCFGTMAEQVKMWFADGKLAHVALYSVAFLELARGKNFCESPDNWPLLNDKEKEKWNRRQKDTILSSHRHSSTRPQSLSPVSGLAAAISALVLRSLG